MLCCHFQALPGGAALAMVSVGSPFLLLWRLEAGEGCVKLPLGSPRRRGHQLL